MMHDPFVTQLAELCRTEPTRPKWVIVPSHATGLTLGERLARDGQNWANLRFVTPLDIAIRMAAPFLLERGIDPSEESLGPVVALRLLLDLPVEGGYFRPMAGHPSMVDALWRTLRELRDAGVRAVDLEAAAFGPAPKRAELVALLSAYERHLEEACLADVPMVCQEAGRHADWCPVGADDVVVEVPDVLWPPVVRRFLDGLPGRRIRPRAIDLVSPPVPRRAALLGAPADRVGLAEDSDAARLRYLQSPASAPGSRRDASTEIFHAGGRDAEIAEVLRRIAASGDALDQVEVACATADHAILVWEQALRLDWPVSVSSGVPAVRTRPGRLLLRFCEWAGGRFASSDLRRLLLSGDCAPAAFEEPGADLTPGQAARLLLRAETTWGRDTYAPALARLAGAHDKGASDPEESADDRAWRTRKAAQTRVLAAWIEGVLDPIPTGDSAGGVSLGGMAAAASAFLSANASRSSAVDGTAATALESALTDLVDTLGEFRCDITSALAFVRARVESIVVGRARPRPGALHVSSLADAGYDGRRRVFLVGLVEGGVFPTAVEDPVLLDAERRAVSPLLATSNDRLDEAVWTTLSRVAAIGASAANVCLSYSCRDTRQFRESFPSWLILQAFRLIRGDAALTYADLAAALGEPVSAVPASTERALADGDWWLAGAARQASTRPLVLAAFPSLAAGIRAEAARVSDGFTAFDGWVPEAGPALDPSRNGRVTSVTTLEAAAACPFRYFLQEGLGLRAVEESRLEADAWLDPLTRGRELHDLYADFMRTLRREQRRPDADRDRARLRTSGRERLEAIRAAMPPPSDEVYDRESREFLEDLEVFVMAECEGRHGTDPIGFEVSFGSTVDSPDAEPLASAEPLWLDLGGDRRLAVRGRIDRLNRIGAGEYEVVDYKTGGYWADKWQGVFAGGTRLQFALYSLAATPLVRRVDAGARVVQGVYLFPAVRGHRGRRAIPVPPTGTVTEVMKDLADVIGGGAFVAADVEGACRWCDFAAACRPGAAEGVPVKRDNPGNAALDSYRRLRGHA